MRKHWNCLLIDNDEDDCDIFLMALQELDPEITCEIVHDGVAALNRINSDASLTPSIIFIDLNMPLMNGKQCLLEMRKIERLKETPIYMYSTSADPRSIEEVKGSGANDFIVKPSSFTALVDLLSRLLSIQKSSLS